jgi:hypothetical protein
VCLTALKYQRGVLSIEKFSFKPRKCTNLQEYELNVVHILHRTDFLLLIVITYYLLTALLISNKKYEISTHFR